MATLAILTACLASAVCSPCICLFILYIHCTKSLIIKIINKVGGLLNIPNAYIPESPSEAFNRECPICHTESTLPVKTNCGHKYCSVCIIGWWQARGGTEPATCPCCRREIVFLLTCYNENGLGREEKGTLNQIQSYNRKYSERNLLGNWPSFYSRDSFAIISHIWNSFSLLPQEIKMAVCLYTVFLIIYLISPFDILPEAVLGPIGLIDDATAIAVYLRQILVRYVGHLASQGMRYAST